ncbi:MAG TPA: endonuclease domain-containing protein [Luteimonas sp.]|nr:endonuclease domain-containing protein [Luteimonas sp.]
MLDHAKRMRIGQTDAEAKLWLHLRGKRFSGFKFKRQQPIGPFIVDFVCLRCRVVVEADGGQHTDAAAYDQSRTNWLEEQGFRVLRFWNNDILQRTNDVLDSILNALNGSR